ncbi:hypothetical protein IPC24_17670 [Pseudomonas aeruginosa]|nr:hypothetical protein IPC775_15985 [Pseudomonas aeruginosa]RQI41007.1 hypothetical protein IPC24_17670 [Pseudomonas aeruginosa]
MTPELVERWHDHVQPLIDSNYVHWAPGVAPEKVRADKFWNWHFNFTLLALHNTFLASKSKQHGEGLAMCIVFRSEDGADEFPIGMLTAVPKLNSNIHGIKRQRAFTWYLSDAPEEVYRWILGIPPIQGVAKTLLDCSIQAALDEGEDGNLLLKADPQGGTKLEGFYKHCGMKQLPKRHPAVTHLFRRHSTDKYFNFLASESLTFCAKFNNRR